MNDLYEEGLKLYKEKKFEEAFALFSMGAKEEDSRCIHARGLCFWQGKGVKQNKALGKSIVKSNIAQLEKDAVECKPGANKLVYLAYSAVDFLVDNKKAFEALQRIYDMQVELEESLLMDLAQAYQDGIGCIRDYVKSTALYKECLEKYGSPEAMNQVALNYLMGLTDEMFKPDFEQGIYYLKKASEYNDIVSIICLIEIYLGVDYYNIEDAINLSLAKTYIDELCKVSELHGKIYMSLFYAMSNKFMEMESLIKEIDSSNEETIAKLIINWKSRINGCYRSIQIVKALGRWMLCFLDKLLNLNYPKDYQLYTYMAYFYQGLIHDNQLRHRKHYDKKETEHLYSKVVEYYLKGIKNEEYLSCQEYANFLLAGEHVEKNEKKAFEMLLKAYCIEQDGDIANQIAHMYEYGIGVRKNKRKAIEYYLKASKTNNGFAWANMNLAYHYTNSKNEDDRNKVKKIDHEIDKRGIDMASENSVNDFANKVINDVIYCKKWLWLTQYLYKKGRRDRNPFSVEAGFFSVGRGVKKDIKKALTLYKKAANQGDCWALIQIGQIYAGEEKGIKRNIPLAIKYIERGSEYLICRGYAFLELYRIYSDKDSKYFDIEKAIKCLENVPEDDEYSLSEAKYLLGYLYHSSGLVKKNLSKAVEHYKQAEKFGYKCEYALELAKSELQFQNFFNKGKAKGLTNREARLYARSEIEKNDTDNAFRQFVVKNLLSRTMSKQEKLEAIKKELQMDFAETWNDLGKEAEKALITGIYIYSAMLEAGVEYYQDLDFAPVINQFSKAYEIQLKKYFYKGFLRYLKRKKISVEEFVNPNETRQIPLVETYYKDKKRIKAAYRYPEEGNDGNNPFSLGSLRYILTFTPFTKNAYYSNEINKHVLAYVKEIFKDDIFEYAHYDIDLSNYLLDLANDTRTIMDRRNPSAHGAFMSISEAEVCANYLMKVKKVIYRFISKIKEEYRGDYMECVEAKE